MPLALLMAVFTCACAPDADPETVPPGAVPVEPDGGTDQTPDFTPGPEQDPTRESERDPVHDPASDPTDDSTPDPASHPESRPGQTFRIDPVQPIDKLEAEALTAEPPADEGEFLETDLVELTDNDPGYALEELDAGARP